MNEKKGYHNRPPKRGGQRHGGPPRKRSGGDSRKPALDRVRINPGSDAKLKNIFARIGVPEPEPFVPDPFQKEALEVIQRADCLVTAPTGAGKTWIATQAIGRIREAGGQAWYASPLKALTNSKFIEFGELFGTQNVGILTGDRKENPDAPVIVGTTEILRNQLYDAMNEGRDLESDFVILDEAHYLGDPDRGVVWEEVMIYLPARVPLLMLSATIGNADEIAAWLTKIRSRRCEVVQATKRPVPLYPLFFHPSGTLYPLISPGTKSKLYKKVADTLHQRHTPYLARPGQLPPFGEILRVFRKYNLLPAIFFLKSRSDCDAAIELCERNTIDAGRKERIKGIIDEFTTTVPHIANHRQMFHLEHLGVGAHHSGHLPVWKLLVESLMTAGLLDAVFATSTVAAGVDFPARTVVFLNSDKFNGIEFLPLTPTEFHQMTGRAGRRGKDRIGFLTVIPGKYMDVPLIAKLVHAPAVDVESQIKINFSMTLNLLLSNSPPEIAELLERSFAAYLLGRHKHKEEEAGASELLREDFMRHFEFLVENGYVSEDGTLTEDGVWASRLRVDQPLLIAEGFRENLFPTDDPKLLAAIFSSFVNEREMNDRLHKEIVPNRLMKAFRNITKKLIPFQDLMYDRGFIVRPLYLRPALCTFLWASGIQPWEKVLAVSELAEGDLAMLMLRTADNLRHVIALRDFFPRAADAAAKAVEAILREPVIAGYEIGG